MFTNLIDDQGQPICPAVDCHKPVKENTGTAAMMISFRKLIILEAQGLIEDSTQPLTIIHKTCTGRTH